MCCYGDQVWKRASARGDGRWALGQSTAYGAGNTMAAAKDDGVLRRRERNASVRGRGDSGARTADEFLNGGVGCEAAAAAASVPEGAWDDARLVLCRCGCDRGRGVPVGKSELRKNDSSQPLEG